MSDDRKSDRDRDEPGSSGTEKKPANIAPDAVKDPNEKTDGHPGTPSQGDETDPGAG